MNFGHVLSGLSSTFRQSVLEKSRAALELVITGEGWKQTCIVAAKAGDSSVRVWDGYFECFKDGELSEFSKRLEALGVGCRLDHGSKTRLGQQVSIQLYWHRSW